MIGAEHAEQQLVTQRQGANVIDFARALVVRQVDLNVMTPVSRLIFTIEKSGPAEQRLLPARDRHGADSEN
jgi:hypothetical protein